MSYYVNAVKWQEDIMGRKNKAMKIIREQLMIDHPYMLRLRK